MTSLSLGEIEALALKAARGAGYDWGLARETGRAVRWLWRHDQRGCAALVDWLDLRAGTDPALHRPAWQQAGLKADLFMCPVSAGCILSDHAHDLPDRLTLQEVTCPLLVLPFIADAAGLCGSGMIVTGPKLEAHLSADALNLSGDWSLVCATLEVSTQACVLTSEDHQHRANPSKDVRARLENWAHKTYAPATEASRLLGAGAGLSDND